MWEEVGKLMLVIWSCHPEPGGAHTFIVINMGPWSLTLNLPGSFIDSAVQIKICHLHATCSVSVQPREQNWKEREKSREIGYSCKNKA